MNNLTRNKADETSSNFGWYFDNVILLSNALFIKWRNDWVSYELWLKLYATFISTFVIIAWYYCLCIYNVIKYVLASVRFVFYRIAHGLHFVELVLSSQIEVEKLDDFLCLTSVTQDLSGSSSYKSEIERMFWEE